jgi:arylformamidase
MKIYDISLEVHAKMVTYPGNPQVRMKRTQEATKKRTALSEWTLGSHTGTHIDVPRHVTKQGKDVASVSLTYCYGPCTVLDLTHIKFGQGIVSTDLEKMNIQKGDIVLLKTKNSSRGFTKFHRDYVYLSEEGATYLAKKKVKTVGVDYLSIQKFHTGRCAAHCALLLKKVMIFEGLNLKGIKAGTFTFAGLPLKLKNSDGGPARAILIKQ